MEPEKSTNLSPNHSIRPALCLDLDGTVRRSKSGNTFIQNFNDIELIPGIEKAIWYYRNKNYLIFGVSNQAGVAHGFKLPMEVENELERTLNLFQRNPFHAVKQCYHDKAGTIQPFNVRSLFRKPAYGMLAQIEAEAFASGHVVDWDNSLFVGDRDEDKGCAMNAGIKFMWASDFWEQHENTPASEIPQEDVLKYIHREGRCCISKMNLNTSKTLYTVPLNYKPNWKRPIAVENEVEKALAFIHERYVMEGRIMAPIRWAIQVVEETPYKIVYHPLSSLEIINAGKPPHNPLLN